MSDPVQTTKSAREGLARGLNALQADPSVPPHLVELAQPIAQAMGALHQIEKTGQLAPHAEVALNHVRGAMQKLQAQPATHPAVAAALEAVAGSLSLVHALSRMANGPAAPPPQAGPPPGAPVPNTAAMPQRQAPPPQMAPQGPPPGFPAPQHMPPQQQMHQMPPQQRPPQQQQQMAPQVARDPFAAADPFAAPRGAPQGGPPPGFHGQPPQGGAVNAPPAGNAQMITADLGAHSPTNFYKGLSGNDIIDHGGLFVSTYVPPKVGTPVRLKVSLPGGYEFEANAVVKWVREEGADAPPGFGAQFTQITNDARQLVYRYVRNREPLFHDDL